MDVGPRDRPGAMDDDPSEVAAAEVTSAEAAQHRSEQQPAEEAAANAAEPAATVETARIAHVRRLTLLVEGDRRLAVATGPLQLLGRRGRFPTLHDGGRPRHG